MTDVKRPFPRMRLAVAFAAALIVAQTAPAEASNDATAASHIVAQKITLKSGELSLIGFLYRPDGEGPFPALIWNHGSEQRPDAGAQFDSVASIFVPAGYVVFAPVRRGHGGSQGRYIVDDIRQERRFSGWEKAARSTVQLLETEQLADQLAGLAYGSGRGGKSSS